MSDETKLDAPKPLADALLAGIAKAKAATAELDKRAGRDPDASPEEPKRSMRIVRAGDEAPNIGIDLLKIDGPVSYLCKRLAFTDGAGPPHMIAGLGSSGKTLLCQELLLSIASGKPAFGAVPVRRARVIHIDYEQGERTTRRRYQRLAAARGIDLAALYREKWLTVIVRPALTLRPEDREHWHRLMAGRGVNFVDSMKCATAGVADENSSEIRAPLDMLSSLSEQTKCRALLTHHFNKAPALASADFDRLRGSAAISEAVDCLWLLRGESNLEQHEGSARNSRPARDVGDRAEPFGFRIEDVARENDPRWGLRISLCPLQEIAARAAAAEEARLERVDQQRLGKTLDKLLATVARFPGETLDDLSARLGRSLSTTRRAILEAGPRLIVSTEEGDRGQRKKIYRLA